MLVLGDHGMSDAGSHGGASMAEVLTPVVAISPGFNGLQTLQQVSHKNLANLFRI